MPEGYDRVVLNTAHPADYAQHGGMVTDVGLKYMYNLQNTTANSLKFNTTLTGAGISNPGETFSFNGYREVRMFDIQVYQMVKGFVAVVYGNVSRNYSTDTSVVQAVWQSRPYKNKDKAKAAAEQEIVRATRKMFK